jgi:trans-aconitate methyltransferase
MKTKVMDEAELYELGLKYWPYKRSLQKVISTAVLNLPENAVCIDMMAGPGYLAGQLMKQRPDLQITAVDIEPRYIEYGRQTYPDVAFVEGDVCTWRPGNKADAVFCTGALHHVEYRRQEEALRNIAAMVKTQGMVIISDCYIDDYRNEKERRLAAAKLGDAYLKHTIEYGAPYRVLKMTAEITRDDVCKVEFKDSLAKREPVLKRIFPGMRTTRTWPDAFLAEYGDYVHVWKEGALK